jgi:hypothetical protein
VAIACLTPSSQSPVRRPMQTISNATRRTRSPSKSNRSPLRNGVIGMALLPGNRRERGRVSQPSAPVFWLLLAGDEISLRLIRARAKENPAKRWRAMAGFPGPFFVCEGVRSGLEEHRPHRGGLALEHGIAGSVAPVTSTILRAVACRKLQCGEENGCVL